MAHYPVKQGLHILSSHNKMRTLQLPRKSRTTSTHDRDAGMGLLSLDLSLTHFAFTLTCMACPPLAPCAFRLPVWMYCYFFQLSGSQFFGGGPKQHLAVVVLKFFDHHDYEFHPKRKNIRGHFASVFVWPFKNNNRYSHEAATSHPTMHSTSS